MTDHTEIKLVVYKEPLPESSSPKLSNAVQFTDASDNGKPRSDSRMPFYGPTGQLLGAAEPLLNHDGYSSDDMDNSALEIIEKKIKNLFEENCAMKVDPQEVERIQLCVENAMHSLIHQVVHSPDYMSLEPLIRNRTGISFSNSIYDHKNLLKVGSFYEGTKNFLPDEFDFIYVVGECAQSALNEAKEVISNMSDSFHKVLIQKISSQHHSGDLKYKGKHGPASKLELVVPGEAADGIKVNVDISVACRFHLEADLPQELKINFPILKEFITRVGSCLLLKVYREDHPREETSVELTITEAEHLYVKSEMTAKHKQIYQILKFLMNGNDGKDEMRRLVKDPKNRFYALCFGTPHIFFDCPSYALKCLMFSHEQYCKAESSTTAVCLLQVLRDLLVHFKTSFRHQYFDFTINTPKPVGKPYTISDDFEASVKIADALCETVESLQSDRNQTTQTPLTDLATERAKKELNGCCASTKINAVPLVLIMIVFAIIFLTRVKRYRDRLLLCGYKNADVLDTNDPMLYTLHCDKMNSENISQDCDCLRLPLRYIEDVPSSIELYCDSVYNETGGENFTLEPDGVLECAPNLTATAMHHGCFVPANLSISSLTLERRYMCKQLNCPPNFTLPASSDKVDSVALCCIVNGVYSWARVNECLDESEGRWFFILAAGLSLAISGLIGVSFVVFGSRRCKRCRNSTCFRCLFVYPIFVTNCCARIRQRPILRKIQTTLDAIEATLR